MRTAIDRPHRLLAYLLAQQEHPVVALHSLLSDRGNVDCATASSCVESFPGRRVSQRRWAWRRAWRCFPGLRDVGMDGIRMRSDVRGPVRIMAACGAVSAIMACSWVVSWGFSSARSFTTAASGSAVDHPRVSFRRHPCSRHPSDRYPRLLPAPPAILRRIVRAVAVRWWNDASAVGGGITTGVTGSGDAVSIRPVAALARLSGPNGESQSLGPLAIKLNDGTFTMQSVDGLIGDRG